MFHIYERGHCKRYRVTGPLFFHYLDCDFHIGLHTVLPYIQVYTDSFQVLFNVVQAVGHLSGFLVMVRLRLGLGLAYTPSTKLVEYSATLQNRYNVCQSCKIITKYQLTPTKTTRGKSQFYVAAWPCDPVLLAVTV